MAIYTVHEPPLRTGAAAPDPERFIFVRDGFSFWAFLFGPLWMLRHRLWLVLLLYIVVSVVLAIACVGYLSWRSGGDDMTGAADHAGPSSAGAAAEPVTMTR